MLKNYLGIGEVPGLADAPFGEAADAGFEIVAEDDTTFRVDYLILSEGRNAPLGEALGLATDSGTVVVDSEFRTSVPRVYAVGRSIRPRRSQAIISAGAGAAVDILSEVAGSDVQDWDSTSEG